MLGVLAANAYVWLETNYPLQQIYGLALSRDRVGNLALCQVISAGNSPLRTAQLGQLHFEPFWGAFVAVLSGFEPERTLRLYPFFSLMTAAGFAAALYFGLRPVEKGTSWSGWERALIAGSATLLSSGPLEFSGIYRLPWSMTFLLKPNHALGLVLFPFVLAVFVRARGWRGRVAAGVALHLLGWVFVLHMVYVAAGLALYAVLSFLTKQPDRRRDLTDVVVTLGVNLLVVSPYLIMLFVGYPFLVPGPMMTIASTSPHLLEVTARIAPLAALAAWGARCAWRRDRLGRVWTSQLLAAVLLWVAYLGLSAIQMARERDDFYYWVRFLTAATAAIGAWDLAQRAAAARHWTLSPAALATGLAFLALPFSLPYWWDPMRMDPYFSGSRAPIEERLRIPTDYLRRHTERDAVVLSHGDYARHVAALGGRRVLLADNFHQPNHWEERQQMRDAVLRDEGAAPGRRLVERWREYHVATWYLVVTPEWLRTVPGLSLDTVRSRPHLEEVHFWGDAEGEFVAIFKLRTS